MYKKVYYYHQACAEECECTNDADVAIIDPEHMEHDEDSWEQVCTNCGEPSEAAQAYEKAEAAYWLEYFSPGMREFMAKEEALKEATDGELFELSRDCGRRVVRPK